VNGIVVLAAQANYRLIDEVTLSVRAQTVLNRKLEAFGALANPAEVLPNTISPGSRFSFGLVS